MEHINKVGIPDVDNDHQKGVICFGDLFNNKILNKIDSIIF
jgi:hypothetical protein